MGAMKGGRWGRGRDMATIVPWRAESENRLVFNWRNAIRDACGQALFGVPWSGNAAICKSKVQTWICTAPALGRVVPQAALLAQLHWL